MQRIAATTLFFLLSLLCYTTTITCAITTSTVPNLTEEQYHEMRSKLQTVKDMYPTKTIQNEFCGTSLLNQNITLEATLFHQNLFGMDASAVCPVYSNCDTLSKRDTYFSPHDYLYRFNLEFIIIQDSSAFYNNVDNLVPILLFELNQYYSGANIRFTASIIKADVLNVNQTVYYIGDPSCVTSGPQPCYNAKTVVQTIMLQRRSSWKLKGSFQVLMANFQTVGLNGFAYFPWTSDNGLVVLSQSVFQSGYSTMAHELGHALGLYHTFRGISEISSCSDPCYESTASSLTGDLCGDTAPVARNWECTTNTLSTSSYPDSCDSSRRSWTGADQTNFMAYNAVQSCRRKFSEHQKRRMRCYASTLTDDITISPNNQNQLYYNSLTVVVLLVGLFL